MNPSPPRAPSQTGTIPPPSRRGFATTIALALVNHPNLLDRFGEEVAVSRVRTRGSRRCSTSSPHHLRARGHRARATARGVRTRARTRTSSPLSPAKTPRAHRLSSARRRPRRGRGPVCRPHLPLPRASRPLQGARESAEHSADRQMPSSSASPRCSNRWPASAASMPQTTPATATRRRNSRGRSSKSCAKRPPGGGATVRKARLSAAPQGTASPAYKSVLVLVPCAWLGGSNSSVLEINQNRNVNPALDAYRRLSAVVIHE